MDSLTFRDGVLGDEASVKGYKVVASDGRVGRVSWATYARGNSYLVITTGVIRRTHRVLPAGAVTQVVDHEVRVAMSRSEIAGLPLLPHPEAALANDATQRMLNAFERAASIPQDGGF